MLFSSGFSLKSDTNLCCANKIYKQHVFMALRDVIVNDTENKDYLIEGLQFYIKYQHPTSTLGTKFSAFTPFSHTQWTLRVYVFFFCVGCLCLSVIRKIKHK